MDQKREVTSVDLVAVVSALQGTVGAVVDKAYLYGDALVRLKLRDFERGRVELLLEVGDVKRAHEARPERVPDAPDRPPDFAKMLRNRIAGAELAAVSQHGFDRILEFEFRREDQDTTIVVELFGEGNVAVLDETGTVIDCLQTIRLSKRTVAPGARYGFPTERPRPDALEPAAFRARVRDSDTDLVRTLATQLDLGGLYAEEICTRAGVEKTRSVAEATDEEIDALYDAVTRLLEPIAAGDLDPRVYYEDGTRTDVTPVPLQEYEGRETVSFTDFNEALDDYFTNLDDEAAGGGGVEKPDFEAEIEKRERIIDQQEQAIEDFATEAERERERAEALYAHYDLVDAIISAVQDAREAGHDWEEIATRLDARAEAGVPAAEAVVAVDSAAGELTIDLGGTEVTIDPAEGVEKNADRLYTEAKRIEEKRAGAEDAVAETREELAELKERRANWSPPDADEDEDEAADSDRDWRTMASVPIRKPDRWHDRFRWFRTSDGFLVIGGRNADQNEELVEKYLDRHDLFFHAQAHGGPATVLKTSEPSEPSRDIDVPEASLTEAAQFAVTYSSVWKEGKFAGDVYHVDAEQVSKTPESGEYLEKGGFAVRGDRRYHEDTPVGCAVGLACEPETRVLGGPPAAIEDRVEVGARLEPGQYAQGDVAKRLYRSLREAFTDTSMVRSVASPDEIQKFMPPGTSRIAATFPE
ncbi:MAG: ribosome rescue protein RqcH [Halobacteriaceae archaeon]